MKLICSFFVLCVSQILCENGYKYCASEFDAISQKCLAVQKGNSQVACVSVIDSADCAIKLIDKKVDFAIFSAEDAFFVLPEINSKVRVIGEMRHKDHLNETYAFETVALVKKFHSKGFEGLRSSNYCHPGFGDGQFWTDRVLKDFEFAVVPKICEISKSNTQIEISSLSTFFKTACRPGQWSFNDVLDKELKKKFSSLCALCDSPGRCAYNGDSQGSHREALSCLTDYAGDVAYVALDYVKEHFGLKLNTHSTLNLDDFKFLCPDGSYRPLMNPCTWVKQPWPVVVASKEKASSLKSSILSDYLCRGSDCRGKWQEAFTLLFEGEMQRFFPLSSNDDSLSSYLNEDRSMFKAKEGDACRNKSVRLCTTNPAEFSKCSWLKRAVISQAIQPQLQCVHSHSLWSCFDLIKKNQADIIGINSEYTFIAQKFNLSTIMYQDNSNDIFFLILPIIKANSSIKSIADFKNKRIAFPKYNGLAWNSFVSYAKKQALLPKKCPYFNAVSAFIKDACVPGIYDVNHNDLIENVPENLCSLCLNISNSSKEKCAANSNNKYYGDFGAFSLLNESLSDVAIVDLRTLFSNPSIDTSLNTFQNANNVDVF